jgi:putative nucleotidyltransferase with HDIG domain
LFDVGAARRLAAEILTQNSDAWRQACTTARRAEEIAPVVGPLDRELLICAAMLHDVGYYAPVRPTEFHPLDGALLLAEAGWPTRIVALVAHHCESRMTAAALGLEEALLPFRREEGPLTDALVYAVMTTGPDGRRMSLRDRLDDIGRRHADEPDALREAWGRRRLALVQAVGRTEQRMAGLHRLGGAAPSWN